MFRLETAIRDWCEALRASGYDDEENIEELRDHLACVIDDLGRCGFTDEEAFLSATGRLGDIEELAEELSKEGLDMIARIKTADVALSTRQMATMLYAGVPLEQSLDIVAEANPSPAMKDVIRDMRNDVSAGKSFAAAFRAHPDPYDELFCRLVDAAEKGDKLAVMLDRIATYKEKTLALNARITRCVLLLGAIFLALFAVFAVVTPRWAAALAATVALLLVYLIAVRVSSALRDRHDRWVLKLPYIGELQRNAAIARFARVLSTTFAAGVPFSEALDWVIGAAGNAVYRDAFVKLQSDVTNGKLLNQSMGETRVFPELMVKIVAAGEHAGTLDKMLDKAASYYEEMVDDAIDRVAKLAQPAINIVLIAMVLYLAILVL